MTITKERMEAIDEALARGEAVEMTAEEIDLFGGSQMLTDVELGIDEDVEDAQDE